MAVDTERVKRHGLYGLGAFVAAASTLLVVGFLITHAGFLGGLRHWDASVSERLVDLRTPWLNRLCQWASRSADTEIIILVAVLTELVLVIRRRWNDLLVLAMGLAIEITTFLTVNPIVSRPRPDVEPLGSLPFTASFPSGHVAASFVLWTSLALLVTCGLRMRPLRPYVVGLAVVIAAFVGFARIYKGMHHTTDVIAGLSLGIFAVVVTQLAVYGGPVVAQHRRCERAVCSHRIGRRWRDPSRTQPTTC